MKNSKIIITIMILVMVMVTMVGCGQKTEVYPSKDVTLVVPYSAGGGTDMVARILAKEAEKVLGGTIAVVNKPGGGSAPGMLSVAQAKSDGYTLCAVAPPVVTLNRLGKADISYEDFQPVVGVNFDPFTITVRADAPWGTIEEFIKYAKENPGKVKLGTTTPGGAWHTGALALEDRSGAKFKIIPFEKGAKPAVVDLLGGNLDAVTVSVPEVAPNVEAGKFRILAVAGDEGVEAFPDVPTFTEVGIDVPPIGAYRGIMAPKGTPEEVIKVLHDAFKEALTTEAVNQFMKENLLGKMYMSTEDWTHFLEEQDKVFADLIKKFN